MQDSINARRGIVQAPAQRVVSSVGQPRSPENELADKIAKGRLAGGTDEQIAAMLAPHYPRIKAGLDAGGTPDQVFRIATETHTGQPYIDASRTTGNRAEMEHAASIAAAKARDAAGPQGLARIGADFQAGGGLANMIAPKTGNPMADALRTARPGYLGAVGVDVANGLVNTLRAPVVRHGEEMGIPSQITGGTFDVATSAFPVAAPEKAAQLAGRGAEALGTSARVMGEALAASGRAVAPILHGPALNPEPVVAPLKAATNAAYQAVRDLNVQYTPEAAKNLVMDVRDAMKGAMANPAIHPKAYARLGDLNDLAKTAPTLPEVDQWRQGIRDSVARSPDPDERRVGVKMVKAFDDFVKTAGPLELTGGDADAGAAAITKARAMATQLNKVQDVFGLVDEAKQQVAPGGGNLNIVLRRKMGELLDDRSLTPVERDLVMQINRGDFKQNLGRDLGKLSPTSGGLMGLAHTGAALATHGLSAGVGASAEVAKMAAQAQTLRRVQQLVEVMANHAPK